MAIYMKLPFLKYFVLLLCLFLVLAIYNKTIFIKVKRINIMENAMKKVAVVIPIYKPEMTEDETMSFLQGLKILSSYPIIIVSHPNLNLDSYYRIAFDRGVQLQVELFDETCFKSISSYSRMMLSEDFYARFSNYEYIFIYQLDAWVFRDELLYWCDKGYDYIGAPLVGKQRYNYFTNSFRVGNGGLCLRKVSAYLDYFRGTKPVFPLRRIIRYAAVWKRPYFKAFVWKMLLSGKNTPQIVALKWKYNEDDFWSGTLDESPYIMSKPDPYEAMDFAFERFPAELYKIKGEKLPFGCHAWKRHQYQSFWRHFIKPQNEVGI